MKKNALFIGQNTTSFIFKSINNALDELGIESNFVDANIKSISMKISKADVILIYVGDFVETVVDAMVFVKDYCLEHEKKISVIGFPEEIEKIKRVIPEPLIFTVYERPINVKELVSRIRDDIEREEMEDNKKHILVVDDSGTMLRTVKAWLSSRYRVSIASSAAMAINFLANTIPDLILLDYEMPICSGPQFLEMIHAEPATRKVPVIFLTGKGDIDSVKQVLKLKPDGYILKSMDQDEIVSYINEFFEKRKSIN